MFRLGSLSHRNNETFWSTASVEELEQEMEGTRRIIDHFANITDNSVIGMRAPFLRVGGNNQFRMMEKVQLLYDSTMMAPLQNPPLWPYTLYYRMPHFCQGNNQQCPTRSFPVWEMVINELDRRDEPAVENQLPGCAIIDSCFSSQPTTEQFYNFLQNNFDRHYLTNRAPLGLYFHSAFLKNTPEILNAFLAWLDDTLAANKDVYFVTMTQVLQWMQDPRPLNQLENYEPWRESCDPKGPPFCHGVPSCGLNTDELPGETVHLTTCMSCPNKYPWLKDPLGKGYF